MQSKRIIELPKQVADKIAAGEVVDRPVSVVKELIENAIDAGASSIIVEIRKGGKTYIRITDNGSGIEKEDVEIAFNRHATSKIAQAKDLDHITTLGFRGEALASIAAVSHTELITKTENSQTGIRLKIVGGNIVEKSEIGCPEGTTLIISNLFFNTPARLKFLKQDSTEASLIIDLVSKVSLAYPNIKFRLINNGSIIFSTLGNGNSYQNILSIYSQEIGGNLIKVEEKDDNHKLEAYISPPEIHKSTKKNQIFFINGRYIKSNIIEKAVSNAYSEKLSEGRQPIVFLFLQIQPDKLDVNIHPNKKEVRFDNESEIQHWIEKALRKVLNSGSAIPEIKTDNFFKYEKPEEKNIIKAEQVNIKLLRETQTGYSPKTEHIESKPYPPKIISIPEITNREKESQLQQFVPEVRPQNEKITQTLFDMLSLTILGSVFSTYIAACDADQFYLIDQHAAHERILYEELLDAFNNSKPSVQRLLNPFIIEVSVTSKYEISDCLDFIAKMGFEIENFGIKSYIVKAVPVFMDIHDAKEFLEDLLENIFENPDFKDHKRIEKVISNSCKKAIKANDTLDRLEIKHLIEKLSKTNNPFSCPHGRPVFIKLSKKEIEKMFKRI